MKHQHKLHVKRLDPRAILPTVAHPDEDAAYDLYALEDAVIRHGHVTKIRTGIAATAYDEFGEKLWIKLEDRSGLGSKGVRGLAGVIDSGYTDEIVFMATLAVDEMESEALPYFDVSWKKPIRVQKGDRVCQMVPHRILTGEVIEVSELETSKRGGKAFGSTGR